MVPIKNGFYVDQDGVVRSTVDVPAGMHFEFNEEPKFINAALVVTDTGMVHDEYVLWPSLEALSAAGVDVSVFRNRETLSLAAV
jgi:ABC-type arginine transport system ATPase subunit